MTTEKPGIGHAMMRYAGGVKKEMKQARGAREKMSVAGSGVAGAPMALLAESAKDLLKPKGTFWGIFGKNKSVMGINLSVGSLLKQSHVFTSSVSSILQIIGALVDVFIAPFLVPIIVPLIKKMASFIGPVREYAQALAEKWVPKISKFFGDIWSGDGSFWSKVGDTIKGLVKGAFKATGLYDWYMDQEVWTVMGAFRESIEALMEMLRFFGIIEDKEMPAPAATTFSQAKLGVPSGPGTDSQAANPFWDIGNNESRDKKKQLFIQNRTQSWMMGPNDFYMNNSQNDGGVETKKDKRSQGAPPAGSWSTASWYSEEG